MTPDEIQAMIIAGDAIRCHVIYQEKHYFKFGTHWIVESDGPVAERVFDHSVISDLERLKEGQRLIPIPGVPRLDDDPDDDEDW